MMKKHNVSCEPSFLKNLRRENRTRHFSPSYFIISMALLISCACRAQTQFVMVMGGPGHQCAHHVIQTTDGGYAIAGWTYSFGEGPSDLLIVKFNSSGNSCIGLPISPSVTTSSPNVTSPSQTVISPFLSFASAIPTVSYIDPDVTLLCFLACTLVGAASNSGPYCEGDTIHLFGGPDGMMSYQWTGPGGFTSILQNPTRPGATMAMSGTYRLIVTDSAGCVDTATTSVVVNYRPYVYCMASGECVHDTIRMHGGGPVVSYLWTGPAGFTSTLMNPIIPDARLANTGWYYFTGTAFNGCSNICSVYVEIEWCDECPQAIVEIICPSPCWQFSSCERQVMIFGIIDTSGLGIDTMSVYFTQIVSHALGGVDTFRISEPSPNLWFSGDLVELDSIIATLTGTWVDGDNIIFILDSVFTTDGCMIYPP